MYTIVITIVAIGLAIKCLDQHAMIIACIKWSYDRLGKAPGDEIADDIEWAWRHMLEIK